MTSAEHALHFHTANIFGGKTIKPNGGFCATVLIVVVQKATACRMCVMVVYVGGLLFVRWAAVVH